MPTAIVGATNAPVASPTPRATASAQMASVPISPFGPCCSVEPMGMMMPTLSLRYASTSGQVLRCSNIRAPLPATYRPASCEARARATRQNQQRVCCPPRICAYDWHNNGNPMSASASPYDTDLGKNAANYVPLSPVTFLTRAAAVYPRRTSVIHGTERYSWAESEARCRRLASALARRGVGP